MNFARKLTAISLAFLMLAVTPAFAAQTAITVQVLKQNNYSVAAGDLTLTFAACDATNGNSFYSTGQEVLLVQNADGASAHTFTVASVPDAAGRTDTSLTNYSVATSGFTAIQLKNWSNGWYQSGGQNIYLSCTSTQLKFAVLRYS